MDKKTTSRFNIASARNMRDTLQNWIDSSQESLDNAESADYPNYERIDALQSRIDTLQSTLDTLEELEDL